ncbi:DUF6443 domain-containing protein [Polaribacter sp. Asnod1-A03]|uniref:DUF6443 domain-containing protein n=1 Tax=Polaribacter sp. Asnod1-A03 TaxID=3160581 RepID=UPI0038687F95
MKKIFVKIILSISILFSLSTIGQGTYNSTFESGMGDWSYESGNDLNWSIYSGSTPSGSTGPSAASEGTYYIYVEASSPNFPSKIAGITSVDYPIGSNGIFSFDYHMYGTAMGSVTLSASSDGISWEPIWTLSGNQGNSWQSAQVDLSNFSGSDVKFRFKGTTGSNYNSDICIDNIQVSSTAINMGSSTVLSDENYVYTLSPKIGVSDISQITQNDNKIESVQYFDGLGRAKQNVSIRAGGNREDIITHIDYDTLGRQDKDYLPYTDGTSSGSFKTGDIAEATNSYYQSNFSDDFSGITDVNLINAYSQKEFDGSPLNRVLKQAAPGADWKLGSGHEIEFDYDTNNATDAVKLFEVTTTPTTVSNVITYEPSLSGGSVIYTSGELYKTITKDENHDGSSSKLHTTEEFKNKQGQVVLKRTYALVNSVETAHDTYYVYDDYGNLTYVLPPKVTTEDTNDVSSTELSELCYQYKYDQRNRLVEKKIPGKGWEYIVYDKLDRPVLTQDANLRAENNSNLTIDKWLFTKYDIFGRIAYTGYTNNDSERKTMQGYAINNSTYTQWETGNNSFSTSGLTVFYSKTSFVGEVHRVYTINYYDTYIDLPTGLGTTITTSYGDTSTTNTKGLPTVSKVKVLDTGTTNYWITTVTYYDEKARPIYVYSKNEYLNTVDIIENKLDDFTGKVLETTTTHTKGSSTPIVTVDRFYYDHADRLTKQTQNINESSLDEVIVENTYDDLGQLKSKRVGGKTTDTNGLQTVDYAYNIRGWLKQINDIDDIGTDLFSFKINYNQVDESRSTPLFNGNISETAWKSTSINNTNNPVSENYSYGYDALNRLITATDNTGHYSEGWASVPILYDKNGNITRLIRNGVSDSSETVFGNMDLLYYSYDSGNKLISVTDYRVDDYGFKDGNKGVDYRYDDNGNMVMDLNKSIGNENVNGIIYNHLNLPTKVTIQGNEIDYVYDATGVKLEKKITEYSNPSPGSNRIEKTITEYAGNFTYIKMSQYTNGIGFEVGQGLQFFSHPEGYVKANGSRGYEYVYQYKDHLGNVRLSYADSDSDGTITVSSNPNTNEIIEESNYYPFGLKHKGYNNVTSSNGNSVAQKFGFGGKELQDELGLEWYDVTARNYDPALGRWMNLDPLTEKGRRFSPYTFGFNNPIYFQDYDGMWPNGPGDRQHKNRKKMQAASRKGKKTVTMEKKSVPEKDGVNKLVDKSKNALDLTNVFKGGNDGTYTKTNGEKGTFKNENGYIKDKKLSANGRSHKLQSKVFSGLGKANVALAALNVVNDVSKAYKADGNNVGIKTKTQMMQSGSSLAGGWAGAKIGATIGAAGGPLGAFVGGLIGGAIGAYVGDNIGQNMAVGILKED